MHNFIGCVVIPTYDEFLEALLKRREEFTTLIWPGHRTKAKRRMVSPYNWFTAGPRKSDQEDRQPPQKAVPFLYRGIGDEVGPPYKVTHVSLAVYMVYDNVYTENSAIQEVLRALRVEHFSGSAWGDKGVQTWYVVTETFRLDNPILYDQLWLIKQDRPLAPNFARGYGLVWLPEQLCDWYRDCLTKHADLLALLNIERWRVLLR